MIDSDGTLLISPEKLKGGTLLTYQIANELDKPILVVCPENNNHKKIVIQINNWLKNNTISVLNIAGPRKSEWDAGYSLSFKIISLLIEGIQKSNGRQNNNPTSLNIKK